MLLVPCVAFLCLCILCGPGLPEISAAPASLQLPAALLVVLWGSAFLSALVDNVPFTAAMIPVIQRLSEAHGLPLMPLTTSLSLGTCLGGNGSLIAASANVVAAGLLEGLGISLSFRGFAKLSIPVTLITIIIATVYVLMLYVLLGVR